MSVVKKNIFLFLLLILFGCGKTEKFEFISQQQKDLFFIEADKFGKLTDAEVFAEKLKPRIDKNIYFRIDSSAAGKFYSVCVGEFKSSYSAGEYAFSVLGNAGKEYQLIQNASYVYDEFANTLFVGNYGGFPSLYQYNIESKEAKLLWKGNSGRVIDLSYKPKAQANFFITIKSSGRKTIFPFINQVKLYRVIQSTGKIDLLQDFGNAVQISTTREEDNSIKITLISLDEKISTFVNQRTVVVNSAGRLLTDQNKSFDLIKENFPAITNPPLKLTSDNQKYSLIDSAYSGKHNFYLKINTKKHYVFSTTQSLTGIEWIGKDYLILSTLNLSPSNKTIRTKKPNTSNLVIVDLDKKKIIENWSGGGFKNFIVKGKFLYFDNDFGRFSKIFVYDLPGKKFYDTITVKGGCGLNNLPVIPDFDN